MPRTDSARRTVGVSPQRVFDALVDPDALATWLAPEGMRATFEHFDARPGGGYRLVLTYLHPHGAPGKTSENADVVEARFIEVTPPTRLVQAVDFVSDDPAFAGTMRMTWEVTAAREGARVDIRADDVPDGISAEDHATGLASSLENLAAFLAR